MTSHPDNGTDEFDSSTNRDAEARNYMTPTILAPAYNESAVIEKFVQTVCSQIPSSWELLVVNDGSTDDTAEILERLTGEFSQLTVTRHETNKGLGAALLTGFGAASGDIIVTMDSDLSHPLDLLPQLVDGCSEADAVYGSRFISGGGMVGVPGWRKAISQSANWLGRRIYRSPTRDLTTGYRAYRTEVIRELPLNGAGFEIQLEITIRLLAANKQIAEVPLVLQNREAGQSKMRYAQLIPTYARTAARMLLLRWVSGIQQNRSRSSVSIG